MTIFYPAEGRNHIWDVTLRGATQVPEWRVAMFEGDYTPQEDDTAANIVARATEIIAYSESTSVLIDSQTRAPMQITDELRKMIAPYIEGAAQA